MLFKQNLLKLIVLHIQFVNKYGPHFYKIDPLTYKLSFQSTAGIKLEMFTKCLIVCCIGIATKLQLLLFRKNFPTAMVYEGILYIVATHSFVAITYVYYSRGSQVVELFNLLTTFEKKLINGNRLIFKFMQNLHIFEKRLL